MGDLVHDVAFVATSTDTCKAALSENTRIQCAPVVVNAAGSSLAMMAEPDDFGETVMYDTGCGISAVFNRETHAQKKLAGRAGDVAPPDNIQIDAAEGSSMGYSGNSWEEFTYGGQTFKVVGAVCDNYHGVTIVGNVTCHKLKALADWEAHTLTFRSMQPPIQIPLRELVETASDSCLLSAKCSSLAHTAKATTEQTTLVPPGESTATPAPTPTPTADSLGVPAGGMPKPVLKTAASSRKKSHLWSFALMCMFTSLAGGTAVNNITGNTQQPAVFSGDDFCTAHDVWPSTSVADVYFDDSPILRASYEAQHVNGAVTVAHTTATSNTTYLVPDVSANTHWQLDDYIDFVEGGLPLPAPDKEESFQQATADLAAEVAATHTDPEQQPPYDHGAGDGKAVWSYAQFQLRLKGRNLSFPSRDNMKAFKQHVTTTTEAKVNAVYRNLGSDSGRPNQTVTADLWEQLGLNDSDWAKEHQEELRQCVDRNHKLFEFKNKPAFTDREGNVVKVPIPLKDDTPVCQRAYRLSPDRLKVLDAYLDELLELGVIRPTSTSEYSSVVVLVPKADGSMRVTCDFRPINKKCKKYAFSPATPQEIWDSCYGSELYSCCDVSKAFYNLSIAEKDVHKTAFATPHRGMFEWLRMPMGLVNSPACLAAHFEDMLRVPLPPEFGELAGKTALGTICNIYTDDICLHSKEDNHHQCLIWLFDLLNKHNVTLRADKCHLGQTSIKYLGMELSKEGLSIDQTKIKAVKEAKIPDSVEAVRRFLGVVGYLRQFIPNFGARSVNLTKLLKKGAVFSWTEVHQQEYDYLINKITAPECLALYDWSKPAILRTDASRSGLGAVLCQEHNGVRRPICYLSRQLRPAEMNYDVRDLECLGLVWGCQKLRPYLLNQRFIVENDHNNLNWLMQYKGTNRRLFNYTIILQDYDFEFRYRKGETMKDADWLSRAALPAPPVDQDVYTGDDVLRSKAAKSDGVYTWERSKAAPATVSTMQPLTKAPSTSDTTEGNKYNVVSLASGIGCDAMAIESLRAFKVTTMCDSDPEAAAATEARTGVPNSGDIKDWLAQVRTGHLKLDHTHVLSCGMPCQAHSKLQRMNKGATPSLGAELFELIPDIAQVVSPDIVLVEMVPPQAYGDDRYSGAMHDYRNITPTHDMYWTLEKKMVDMGYKCDSRVLNTAEHGDFTARHRYVCVCSKLEVDFAWMEPLEKYYGCPFLQDPDTVDPRLRMPAFSVRSPTTEPSEFEPRFAGTIQGGGYGKRVYDPSKNPLPTITTRYNAHTRHNGGQFIVDKHGARTLTQVEMARAHNFTDSAIAQLQNMVPAKQQHFIGNSMPIATLTAVYQQCQKVLDEHYALTMPNASGEPNTREMPNSVFVAGMEVSAGLPPINEIKAAQHADEGVKSAMEFVIAGKPKDQLCKVHPDYRRFVDYMHVDQEVLYFRDIFNDEWITDALVLPTTLVPQALYAYHDSVYSCHLGFHKTKVAMMERVWFPRMNETIKQYIADCEACRKSKAMRRKHAGYLQSRLYTAPFENVAIDLQGPYLQSEQGNKYHLHIICLFTNYSVTVPLPDKTMETVAKAFHKHVILTGPSTIPATVISDRGTEFLNQFFEAMTTTYGIKHLKTVPYAPTSNAQCERGHRVYNEILRTMLHKYGVDWDEALVYATWCLNTHAIEGCNISPYEMVFGRKPTEPNQMMALDNPIFTKKKQKMEPEQYFRMLRSRMADVHTNVTITRLERIRYNNTLAKRTRYTKAYKPGDLVNLWRPNVNTGIYGKLAYKCVGPFEVISRHSKNDDVYVLRRLGDDNARHTSHHVRDLVPYISKEAYTQREQAKDSGGEPENPALTPTVGMYMLLPYGSTDYVCQVQDYDSRTGMVSFQYLNTESKKDKTDKTKLALAWKKGEDGSDEIYTAKLTPKLVTEGYTAVGDIIHQDEFYQAEVPLQVDKKHPTRFFLAKHKRLQIKKAKPLA